MADVELVAGHVRVGDATFPGGPRPDGRVAVLGARVRRLLLGERDDLVSLARGLTGTDPAAALATWVLAAAVTDDGATADGAGLDGLDGLDDERAAALAAIALHLAGAALDGPLVQTRLLASRGTGATHDLAAADADALADELAHALRHATGPSADDGWTRIELAVAPDEPTATDRGTPAAVRDRLAAALLARADAPLDPDLAALLLQATAASAVDAGAWAGPATTPHGAPAPQPSRDARPPAAHVAGPGAVRWSVAERPAARSSPEDVRAAAAGSPVADAPSSGGTDAAGPDRARAAGRAVAAPAGTHPPTGVPAGPARTAPQVGADARAAAPVGADEPAAAALLAARATAPGAAARSGAHDRWGAPVDVLPVPWPVLDGPAASADAAPGAGTAARTGRPAVSSDRWLSVAPPRPGAPLAVRDATPWRAHRPDAWDAPSAADGHGDPHVPATDADALALALHRAADLRGVRR